MDDVELCDIMIIKHSVIVKSRCESELWSNCVQTYKSGFTVKGAHKLTIVGARKELIMYHIIPYAVTITM